jgi:copper chaperone CopZ
MKKLTLTAILAGAAGLLPNIAIAKDATATLAVTGWHCGSCSSKTEAALKKVKGVKSAKAHSDKNTVEVAYDDSKTNEAALLKAVKSAGFEAKAADAKN